MIVTYHLEKWQDREIIRLELMEGKFKGVSSIVPERSLGENYKIVVAVLEEYEGFLKEAKSAQIFGLFEKLEEHFPEHPKVLFSLSCAMLDLFSKRYGVSFEEMLDVPERTVEEVERADVLVFPEAVGHVFRVAGFLSAMRSVGERVFLVIREYPDPVTNSILNLLKKLSNGFVEGSWG
ncbi:MULTISPECIES: hypothetical protein [Thermotoga]|jgi:hypothetical protein|uniref:Uncharacterized protein n=1 Tax=Thermotoga neapolitana (strain ATCC 49049 / DSM 4359 / NBRC 107923 / NS-E) TaxID=309803 RepID=B9K6P1_THENN|nr:MULTISPECIES: hypothetical protein [Thermotoga]MDK2785471.1 hypothetical protein [Thermotoga sp.]HBF11055.1 hypothetical protein [Thermotoga neapolitana]ACM22624.1 Putative uncharacterized protein [Thermotoga neapolitana DSM 4359]AJG40571.1 hypothetical protein TRQ7_03705 [Thermotoga sp. RQ7]KFZ22261.1 hypothetical protein LA10_02197 [Thermotoga neapolitana LA10]